MFHFVQDDIKRGAKVATAQDIGRRAYVYAPGGRRVYGIIAAVEPHPMFSAPRVRLEQGGRSVADGWALDECLLS